MQAHLLLSDDQFLRQFRQCTLDPALFTHEAHLRLAWLVLRSAGSAGAVETVPRLIRQYVAHLGAEDKFNLTLTVAATKAVDHFLRRSRANTFPEFMTEFPRLKHNFRDLMAAHYGFDIYGSARAKVTFLEPDLLPFD